MVDYEQEWISETLIVNGKSFDILIDGEYEGESYVYVVQNGHNLLAGAILKYGRFEDAFDKGYVNGRANVGELVGTIDWTDYMSEEELKGDWDFDKEWVGHKVLVEAILLKWNGLDNS